MDSCIEYSALASSRRDMYGFLARMYRVEVDQEILDRMKGLHFSAEAQSGEFAKGARLLDKCVSNLGFNAKSELAVDYARVFLSAGIADGSAAFPYESVYTSEGRLMMQEARDEVVAAYGRKGLGKAGSTNDPEDHIAFELEFMAFLIEEGLRAAQADNKSGLAQSIGDQVDFLGSHLLNWVPWFCSDVLKYAGSDFYRSVAYMTTGFLRMDESMLERLLRDAA